MYSIAIAVLHVIYITLAVEVILMAKISIVIEVHHFIWCVIQVDWLHRDFVTTTI